MKARVLAVLRSLEHKVADYPHLMLTSCTGEVGAASGPLMLAYLASGCPAPMVREKRTATSECR
ncbi:hypothetical protein [Escherichia coli]|uniref:hypothetical protein n=1 Tax=Escherichia coli TaxID=562 RepID=UPI00221FDAD5|nr:hypothetical protein [Escherichia coli]MCW1121773.1 hypothetical protein [Escherichia coli]